ncbi:hypothetical protein NA57DRAFT_70327 [Rhizodiscina lignyota]|uniref:RING-type domain-containing protein n=1 Tax=Rhizodiscina lignyota TaxID=1504668 RepID=A0A9P4MAL0_9PEZI|nr:hypothetical protein NA57DRAFT_70327 [Rhizodiscina lignyota]
MPRSKSRASSTEVWDPWAAFNVYNDERDGAFTCTGETIRGKRCQKPLGPNKRTADDILNRLARQQPSTTLMNDELEELAHYSSCGQYKEAHSRTAAAYFKRIVADLENAKNGSEPASASAGASHENIPISPEPEATDSTPESESTITALLQTIEDQGTTHNAEMQEIRQERDVLQEQVSRLLQERNAAEELARAHRAETESLLRQCSELQTLFSSLSLNSEPNSEDCSEQHTARRPVDNDCSICYESMMNSPAEKLVWCKKECGKSVHKLCFIKWQTEQIAPQGRSLRCIHCRADWTGPCSHDNILPRDNHGA